MLLQGVLKNVLIIEITVYFHLYIIILIYTHAYIRLYIIVSCQLINFNLKYVYNFIGILIIIIPSYLLNCNKV